MTDLRLIAKTISDRRHELGLDQSDMRMKIGMSQQQYQRIEAGNDLRVSSLLRVLDGLGLQLLLVPDEVLKENINEQRLDQLPDGVFKNGHSDGSDWEEAMRELED